MDLSKIISVSGYPGLYKVVAQAHNGIIVESLIDKKRMQAFNSYKISSLDDITIFTDADDLPLREVMSKLAEHLKYETCGVNVSENESLKKFFGEVINNYDKEKVHVSDMKKIINWYNLLQKNDLLKAEAGTDSEGKDEKNAAAVPVKEAKVTSSKGNPVKDNTKTRVNTSGAGRKTATVRKTGA